jgi:hypothetical protein
MVHAIRFHVDSDDGDIWVTVHLINLVWYKRLWVAVKYVFGRLKNDIEYEETLLGSKDFHRLKDVIRLAESVHSKVSKNSNGSSDGETTTLELNIREARVLERLVCEARSKSVEKADDPIHESVHTVHSKLVESYEKLSEHERRSEDAAKGK